MSQSHTPGLSYLQADTKVSRGYLRLAVMLVNTACASLPDWVDEALDSRTGPCFHVSRWSRKLAG